MRKGIIRLLSLLIALPALSSAGFAAESRTLITKCGFEGSHVITAGHAFLYIFGEREISADGKVTIKNFEVEHEIAGKNDDISSNELPNLDESDIRPADFPISRFTRKRETFSVHWTHPPIAGLIESTILRVIVYEPKAKYIAQTNGIQSALAYQHGFSGVYPSCRVVGMAEQQR